MDPMTQALALPCLEHFVKLSAYLIIDQTIGNIALIKSPAAIVSPAVPLKTEE